MFFKCIEIANLNQIEGKILLYKTVLRMFGIQDAIFKYTHREFIELSIFRSIELD